MFRDVLSGIGYIEGYGSHPGTPVLLMFFVLGTFSLGSILGGIFAVIVFLPAYLVGAYHRTAAARHRGESA